jgi:hypothetical protein
MRVDVVLALFPMFAPVVQQPDLATLLRRAGEYARVYHEHFSALVADEDYVQRTGPDPRRPPMGRSFVEKERAARGHVASADLAVARARGSRGEV